MRALSSTASLWAVSTGEVSAGLERKSSYCWLCGQQNEVLPYEINGIDAGSRLCGFVLAIF